MNNKNNDIKENTLLKLNKELLTILLKDNTTNKNIIWATDTYFNKGIGYRAESNITIEAITGYKGNVIKPRVEKSKREKQMRVKNKAEVFTPSWVCNAQNNLIDNQWLGSNDSFNYEIEKDWITNYNKIEFTDVSRGDWKDYVKAIRLEVSCGEAPYITSRYDTVTGEYIEVSDRIGILDRKLRIVTENTESESQWIEGAIEATKATYGYDFQGDNVLIARENTLYTILEHFESNFFKAVDIDTILKFAKIIAWNIWQMDGIKFVIPNSCKDEIDNQINFFSTDTIFQPCEGCKKNDHFAHTGIYSKIMDWEKNIKIRFIDLIER